MRDWGIGCHRSLGRAWSYPADLVRGNTCSALPLTHCVAWGTSLILCLHFLLGKNEAEAPSLPHKGAEEPHKGVSEGAWQAEMLLTPTTPVFSDSSYQRD